jgi:TolB-like protein/Tfp pilus assembly protein PilF
MGSDEDKAFDMLKRNHNIHATLIEKHNGTLIKEVGDGTLASFPLASDTVRCAIEIQKACEEQNIPLKIGIHEGEMVFAGADVLGDGVNIASRLQESAEEGCINISGSVYRDIKNKTGIKTEFLEEKTFKNVDEPIKVYNVVFKEKKEEVSTEPQTQQVLKKSKTSYYIIGGLIVIIAAILIWRFLPITNSKSTNNNAEVADKSVAVLPFRNDSPDQENEYFCNGMMEDIITNLQNVSDLNVRSRTSVEQYRNPDMNVGEIASELNVSFIVEGSVQKVGDKVKITVQLIKAISDEHLWAETYAGKYTDDIFEFQAEVAKKVASSLQAVITPVERNKIDQKPTTEIVAYDLILQGVSLVDDFLATRDLKYLESAHNIFDRAIAIDPNYGRAYWGKGHAFAMNDQFDSAMLYAKKINDLDPKDPNGYYLKGQVYNRMGKNDLAFEYFSKAIEHGYKEPWVYYMLGLLYCREKNDYVKGLPYMYKAIQERPSGMQFVFNYTGWTFLSIGDYERAFKYFKSSIDIGPACFGNIPGYTWTLALQEKLNESLNFIDSICSVTDCESQCARSRFWVHTYLNEYGQAETAYNQYVKIGGSPNIYDSVNVAFVYEKLDKKSEAIAILENIKSSYGNLLNKNTNEFICYCMASVQSQLENKEEALQYLSKAVEIGLKNGSHDLLLIDPSFENLRDDPEFKAIVKRAQDEKAAIRAQVQEMVDKGEIDL